MPLGMCLDAGAPHSAGRVVGFQPCASTTTPRQQWGYTDGATFEGTADGRTLDGYCFTVQGPDAPGSLVVLASAAGSSCGPGSVDVETFQPEAGVGVGAAGPAAGQLVNAGRFGRCLDVPERDVGVGYLVAAACIQTSDPAGVGWSQKWTVPEPAGAAGRTGRIATGAPAGPYCLQSPGSTAAGQYVRLAPCPTGATPVSMTWTVYADTGRSATSYRITDGYGYCLLPTDRTGVQPGEIVVAPCTGSTLQKWNAPPSLPGALPLTDIAEA
jgi:hypothetical protein